MALVAMAPAVLTWSSSSAFTPALECGSSDARLPWQGTPVPAFPPVDGVTTQDRIANYAVQPDRAKNQIVTNGVTVQASETNGCTWGRSFSLSAAPGPGGISATTARITAAALLPRGRGLLAVREGSGAASRPRMLGAASGTGSTPTTWQPAESGLPPQGSPGLLVPASDGSTVYVTIDPTGQGGDDGGGVVLPPIGGGGELPVPGLVYASTDGGRTWASRTAASELPGRVTAFAVDRQDPNLVYAVVAGDLYRSADGGRAFTATDVSGVRALVTMGSRQVAAFTGSSAFFSSDAMATVAAVRAPSGITSAAYRGESTLAVEAAGVLYLLDPTANGKVEIKRASTAARAGSLSGDQGPQATFHAIAGHGLIRYVDPQPPRDPADPPISVDGVPPPRKPNPGVLTPGRLDLKLEQGASRTVQYQLKLPKNPTPLDVMYLLDASPTMDELVEDLKKSVSKISRELVEQQIDVHTGIAVLTTGPVKGDLPYPDLDPLGTCNEPGGYVKPEVFKLIRPIGPPDSGFASAVGAVKLRCSPSTASRGHEGEGPFNPPEAQVLALDQLRTGSGVSLVDSQGSLLIPAGQKAGWRPSRFNRKVILLATDEPFISNVRRNDPNSGHWVAGSPEAGGRLDVKGAAERLRDDGVLIIGIDPNESELPQALADLQQVARITGALAPKGGALCDPASGFRIKEGQPIVCRNADNFGDAILAVLRGLVDAQDIGIKTTTGSAAVTNVNAPALRGVNVAQDNALRFSVTYSCADLKPGTYKTTLETRLRGAKVGVTVTNLTCVKAAAPVIKPLPEVEQVQQVPPQPAQPALPAPAPPAPAAQPQVQPQVQVQVQVNPMTAAMLEQQEQLQLALALNAAAERPSDGTELAMVDRRSKEETSAQIMLLASMAAASALGVRRLRARPEVHVRRVR